MEDDENVPWWLRSLGIPVAPGRAAAVPCSLGVAADGWGTLGHPLPGATSGH